MYRPQGFTLAELLIALAILGVIATFTIPKVLQSQSDGRWKAAGKEAVATFSGAVEAYRQTGNMGAGTAFADLTPFINYVRLQTTGLIDDAQTDTSIDCSVAGRFCLVMHNGGVMSGTSTEAFGGITTSNAIKIHFDPDGIYSGSPTGTGKAIPFYVYYNGRVTDRGNVLNPTQSSTSGYTPNASKVPPWWDWN